ncbi:MAG: hypothetical protein ACI4EA_01750, partial [Candidatus Ornithomonoglobus sp.]
SNVYLNVYGNMDIISVKADYDADKRLWMAALEAEQGFLPVNVEVQVKGYGTKVDSSGDYISTYSYSVDDLNDMAKAASKNFDVSEIDTENYEAIDSVYGIYKLDSDIAAMENGYVSYSANELSELSMGLENERLDSIELDDGTVIYMYSGGGGGIYVSQLIADCDTALKLNSIFDEEYVRLISGKDDYAAFTTVMLLGVPEESVDRTRSLFEELGDLAASSGEDDGDAVTLQVQGFWDNVWDAASEVSNKMYIPSQIFIDWMSTVNTLTDTFDAALSPNFEKALYNADSFAADQIADEYEGMQTQYMYDMYKSIDVNSPYFKEATDIINEFDKFDTTLENTNILETAAEFLANVFDKSGKVKDGISIFGRLASITDKSKTAGYFQKMSTLADKERQRKNGDNSSGDSSGSSSSSSSGSSSSSRSGSSTSNDGSYYNGGSCHREKYSGSDSSYCIDPSGYVCEAVPSNRIEGVTATVYYLDDELDDFGVPTGKKISRLWNAEDYDQINPLITDANGSYAWDVPEGQWQVKFEKDGYGTVYSDWMPVPPPQTEVNAALISNAAPAVDTVTVYEDNVKIYFTQ